MDADSFIYSTVAKAQFENPCEGHEGEMISEWPVVRHMFDEKVRLLKAKLKVDNIQMFISGDDNFRYTIFPNYKANRQSIIRPMHLNTLKDYCEHTYNAIRANGAEADDYTVWYALKNPKALVCAIDKDIKHQVPNKVYDYWKEEFCKTDKSKLDFNFYLQVIIGDSSDNIKGAPGIGPKKALKFISEDMTEVELQLGTLRAYESVGLSLKEAELSARLVRMDQFNPETSKLELFNFSLI